MADLATESSAEHGDSGKEVILPKNDGLDSPDFLSDIARSVDQVHSGGEPTEPTSGSPDQGTADNRDDSRESADPFSDTEDWSEGSHATDTYRLDEEDDDGGEEPHEAAEDEDSAIDVHDDPDEDEDEYDAAEDGEEVDEYDDESEEEGERDQVEDLLTPKQIEAMKKDPKLGKMARSISRNLQRDYTQKTQEVAEARREVEARGRTFKKFEEQLSTPQGMADYLSNVMGQRPDVAAAALVGAMTGEEAEGVLTEIGLEHPKLVAKVVERIETLNDDPGAMKNHQLGVQLKMERQRVAIREQRLNQRRTDHERARIEGSLNREMARQRVPKAEWGGITATLQQALEGRVSKKNGSIDFTGTDIQRLVSQEKEVIDRAYKRAMRNLRREQTTSGRKKAKKLAGRNKNRRGRSAPKSRAPARPRGARKSDNRSYESMGQAIAREFANRSAN